MQNIVFFALAAMQYVIYCVYLYVRPHQARQATYKTHSEEYNLHQMQQGNGWNKYRWKQQYYGDSAKIGVVYEILTFKFTQ